MRKCCLLRILPAKVGLAASEGADQPLLSRPQEYARHRRRAGAFEGADQTFCPRPRTDADHRCRAGASEWADSTPQHRPYRHSGHANRGSRASKGVAERADPSAKKAPAAPTDGARLASSVNWFAALDPCPRPLHVGLSPDHCTLLSIHSTHNSLRTTHCAAALSHGHSVTRHPGLRPAQSPQLSSPLLIRSAFHQPITHCAAAKALSHGHSIDCAANSDLQTDS